MSFNASKLRQKLANTQFGYKKAYGKGFSNSDFPFIRPKQLPDGHHRIRFLPPVPGKNDNEAFYLSCTHQVPQQIGESEDNIARTFCLMVDGLDCAICDLLEAMQEEFPSLDQTTQDCLSKASPYKILQIPCVIGFHKDPAWREPADNKQRARKDREYAPIIPVPDGKLKGAVFTIDSPRLMDETLALIESDEFLNHERAGRYLLLKKSGSQYDIKIDPSRADRCPLEEIEFWDGEKYPDFQRMAKNIHKWGYAEQIERMQKSYWWKGLSDYDIQLGAPPPPDNLLPAGALLSGSNLPHLPY